jgi:hypothetical protein
MDLSQTPIETFNEIKAYFDEVQEYFVNLKSILNFDKLKAKYNIVYSKMDLIDKILDEQLIRLKKIQYEDWERAGSTSVKPL